MGANFTPDWNGYTNMKPFKFWCQKVLPTVYDDSLSYYEVLCKLVKYLNQVIENMEKVEQNTDALLVAFNELQGWVNDYFDNLDVQDEIDHKIDEMVEDGTFDRWIEPIIEGYEGDLQALLNQYAGDAAEYVKSAEAWAKGTKNGEPVTSDDPQYHNNSKYWSEQSEDNAEDAEAWAKGTKDGTPVTSDEPQYHDNAKYWAEQAQQSAGGAGGYDEDAEAWAVGTKNGEPVASDEPQYQNSSKFWANEVSTAITDLKEFDCKNAFIVWVRGLKVKSKSSIVNANNLGFDHAGMVEFCIPFDCRPYSTWETFGDLTRTENPTAEKFLPYMIAAREVYRYGTYDIIPANTSGIGGLEDADGQHFFALVWDRANNTWAADGTDIDIDVLFTLVRTTNPGIVKNGTYE